MKLVKLFSIAAAGLMLVAACGSPKAEGSKEVQDLLPSKGQIDTTSYLLGVNFGLVISQNGFGDLNMCQLRKGMNEGWIDVYQNVGKRSGAYSAGAHVHPFVLLNYTGTLDSQFTLAHELGHALHSYHSNRAQTFVDSDYVIFVAEVASTCNEALLMEYLLQRTEDKKERAALINHFLEQFKGTLYRQTMFAEFELKCGELVQQGQTLTADALCELYRFLNEQYFGPDMVVDDRIARPNFLST